MQWSKGRRLAFRFIFVYTFLYIPPFSLVDLVPDLEGLSKQYQDALDKVVTWAAAHVFGIAREVKHVQTGSGDSMADYVQLACIAAFALIGTAIWSVAGRRPPFRDRALWEVLHTYTRYMLGLILLGYGFAKVFKAQFPFPPPDRLLIPMGYASPMGLVWRFMGYSTPYTIFTGLAEVAGGVLLFFRRTTLLGALILVGVMTNVVMLNFCYDVPVKLFSSHLLLMAVLLTWPDLRRLARVFVLNRPAPAADLRPHDLLVRFRGPVRVVKGVFIAAALGVNVYSGLTAYHQWGDGAPRGELYGAYEVEVFEQDGKVVAPLLTETGRWRRVGIGNNSWGAILMNDTVKRYYMEYDAAEGKATLTEGPEKQYVLTVTKPDAEHLQIEGKIGEQQVAARLKRIDLSSMPLISRGFNWINEFPLNR